MVGSDDGSNLSCFDVEHNGIRNAIVGGMNTSYPSWIPSTLDQT
jgi:hypothetical protein